MACFLWFLPFVTVPEVRYATSFVDGRLYSQSCKQCCCRKTGVNFCFAPVHRAWKREKEENSSLWEGKKSGHFYNSNVSTLKKNGFSKSC